MFPEAGGRVTVSQADDAQVTQLDENTITFSLKPMGRDTPVFDTRLTYDAASKSYVLSVKSGHGLSVEKLRLTYAEPTGFSGEGTMTALAGKTFAVQANITAEAAGGYEWTVRDSKAPPGNSSVFRFWFDKRLVVGGEEVPGIVLNPVPLVAPGTSAARVRHEDVLAEPKPGTAATGEVPKIPSPPPPGVIAEAGSSAVGPTAPLPAPRELYSRAYAHYAHGSYDLAIQGYTEYLRAYSDTDLADNAQFWIALCLYETQRYQEAIEAWNALFRNFPSSERLPDGHLKAGMALEKLGRRGDALVEFRLVVERFPQSEASRLARERLKR